MKLKRLFRLFSFTFFFQIQNFGFLFLFLTLFFFNNSFTRAQGCGGGFGTPIFKETFGAGTSYGPALTVDNGFGNTNYLNGATNYQYWAPGLPGGLNDNQYTITSQRPRSDWINTKDHTGDPNGKFLLVNASYAPGTFYIREVTGLCKNTNFLFSAWFLNVDGNVCGGYLSVLPVNIKFIVSDSIGNILDSASTGNIRPASNYNNQWQNFSFPINTGGYSTVYVQLVNNAPGGCGNDLAIDDISFQPCGPAAVLTGPTGTVCSGNYISFNTKVSSGYASNYYQWQVSSDGGITWGDIAGANSPNYSINSVLASQNGYKYRTLVAGSADNVKNTNCSVISNVFTLNLSNPVLTFSAVPPQCVNGGTLNLTSYASPSGGTFSGKGITGNTLNLAAAGTGIDTIIYNYTSPITNCSASTVGYVTIQPNPIAKITVTGASSACFGSTVLLSIPSGDHIQWYYNGKTISGATGTNYYASATGSYKAVITSNGGCVGMDSTKITIFPNPNLQVIGSSASICLGDTSTLKSSLVGNTYKWTLNHSKTLVGNTGTYKATVAGLYTLTITDINGCTDSASYSVTVNALPTVGNPQISGDTVICKGSTVSFGIFNLPNYISYQWYKNGVAIPGATSSAYTATDSGHYYIQVTDINGCKGKSRVIQVLLAPSPAQPHIIASLPTSLCSPGTVALSINPVAGLIYQWRRNGIALPNSNKPNFTASSTGVYSVLVENVQGCTALSDSVPINIYPKPTASVSYPTLITCNGVPIPLSVNPAPSPGDTYQWYKNGVLIGGQTGSTYSSTGSGSYNYVITNANGCKDTSGSVSLTIYPSAVVNIIADGPTTFCNPGVVTLEATSTFASYQWYLSGVPIPGATGSTYDATTGGTYSLHVVDVNGCPGVSSVSIPVIVNPQTTPLLSASGPTSFCIGGSVILTATASSGGGTYAWFVNGKSIPSKYIVGNTYTATSSGTYTVTYTNVSGCTASSLPIVVQVNPLPTPAIQVGGTVQLCPPGSGNPPSTFVLHLVKPVIGSTYTWTLTDTLTHGETIVSTGKNDSTYTVPTSGSVEGYYKVQELSTAGCIGFSDSVLIRLYKPPISGLQALTVCQGDSVSLFSPPGKTFQWYYSPSGMAGTYVKASTFAGLGSIPDNQKIYKAIDSGFYYVYVFDGNCYGTSATIQVRGLKPIVASIPAVAPFCQGTTSALNVAVSFPGPDISGLTYRYQWYFLKSGGTQFDSVRGGIFNQIGADSSGTYKVIVSAKIAGTYCPAMVLQTTVVNQPVKPHLTVGLKDSLCLGSLDTIKIQNQLSIISAPATPTYQWYRNTVSLPGHTSDTLITNSSGNYYVIVTDGNGCVLNSDTATLISVPSPKPTITSSGPTRFCRGGTDTIYTALQSGYSYQWYRKLKSGSPYLAVAPGGTSNRLAIIDSGIYKVVVTNSTGCIGMDSITIRVDSVPVVNLPASITICPGTSQTLKVITHGAVQWSYGNLGNILSTSDSISANLAGKYYVKVKNSANALCFTLDSVQVNFYAKPVMNFFSPSSCQKNDTVSFVNTSSISDGTAINYSWNFGDPASGINNTSTLSSPTHIYASVGTYTVQLKGMSIHGCVDSITYTFSFLGTNPKSKFKIGASANYCAGQPVSLRDTSTIALGTIAHYHWDVFTSAGVPAKVVTDTVKDIQIVFPDTTATLTYRIRETVSSKAGCWDTSSQTIQILGIPKVTYQIPQRLVCIGSGLDSLKGGLPANGTSGGVGVYSGAGVTGGVFNPLVAGLGKHPITYTFTPSSGVCPASAVDTIQVLGEPSVTSFTKALSINPCDTLVPLKVIGTGITSYEWFRNDTLIIGADSSIYQATRGGKYKARIINALGCYVDTTITFGLNPHPRALFVVGSICQNLTVYFTNLSSIPDKSNLKYQWNFGDPASGQNTSVLSMPHHQYPSAGKYTVTLIAQSNTGCQDTLKMAISVSAVDSNANFTIKANKPYCTNESLIFIDSSSLPAGKIIKQYTWRFYDATGALIKQDTGAEVPELFPIKGNLPQVYSAQEFLNTGDSCLTASPIKQFTINPITPLSYLREAPFDLCIYTNPFNLTGGSTVPGGQPGTGYYSGNGVVAQKTFDPKLAGVGNAIVSYIFTNQYGCTNSVSTNYDVIDTIALTGSNLTVQEGTKVSLNGIGALPFTFGPNGITSINADSLKWNWSPSTGLSSPNDTTPSFIATNDINYTLTVTSPKGCISRAEFQIHVKLNLFVPNTFTPNGDGIHDTWHVKGLTNYANPETYIFNRWGEQLWYFKGSLKEFDGFYQGKPLPAGTYYYLIKFNQDGQKPISGPLTIIY